MAGSQNPTAPSRQELVDQAGKLIGYAQADLSDGLYFTASTLLERAAGLLDQAFLAGALAPRPEAAEDAADAPIPPRADWP